ncbi:MAG TPA: response regulator transcription factor [Rhodocyclaceae bacterium]|nr:response regulator transcription factor [Rhodocyclaceae bacterium]
MTIRIALVDDHKMFRETLRIPLELEDDLGVVAEAGSGAELLAQLERITPDIVVLDIGLPDMSGIEVAQQMAKRYPEIRVVVLSGYTDKLFVEEMMKAGARGFVAKSAGAEELIFAIRATHAGKVFLSPEVTAQVVRQAAPRADAPRADAPPLSILGKREQEVLRLLADGKSSPETATALGISPATADAHRRNIKQKLGLNTIAELTRYAIREGLVSVK